MIFQKLDFISPYVTLHFEGQRRHSSIVSGLISVVSGLVIFITSILFLIEVFSEKNPNAFFFQKHINDTGRYDLGTKGIFHFISFGAEHIKIDLTKFRIIGVMVLPSVFFASEEGRETFDYWEYGPCNNHNEYSSLEIDRGYLSTNSKNSYCIVNYYNHTSKTFHKVGENGFTNPYLDHGASSQYSINYGLYILRSDEVDNTYLSSLKYYTIHFIDTFVDVDNYRTPFSQFFYNISNQISTNSFAVNHINFNPAIMNTFSGVFFDSVKETRSFSFLSNAKNSYEPSSSKRRIVGSFYFWMQNRSQVYQRSYKKLQDALANIGGVSRLVAFSAYIINAVYHEYIIVFDLNKIFGIQIQHQLKPKVGTKINILKPTPTLVLKKMSPKKNGQALGKISFPIFLLHFIRIRYQRSVNRLIEYRKRVLSEEKFYKIYETVKLLNYYCTESNSQKKYISFPKFLQQNTNSNHLTISSNNMSLNNTAEQDKEQFCLNNSNNN